MLKEFTKIGLDFIYQFSSNPVYSNNWLTPKQILKYFSPNAQQVYSYQLHTM